MTEEEFDLFDDAVNNPGDYPEELIQLLDKMNDEYIENGSIDSTKLGDWTERFEQIGYSFEYDLSFEPYNLHKIEEN